MDGGHRKATLLTAVFKVNGVAKWNTATVDAHAVVTHYKPSMETTRPCFTFHAVARQSSLCYDKEVLAQSRRETSGQEEGSPAGCPVGTS